MEEIFKATHDIESRIPEFNISEVYKYLKELHKTNPSEAQALNHPIGWEEVWIQIKD